MQNNPSKEELERILKEKIFIDFFKDSKPQNIKEAFILGGQPGSGKSTLARELLLKNNNLLFINADDLRIYHPYYFEYLQENDEEAADKTQPAVNFWTEELLKETVKRELSFVIEGTMRTLDVPKKTAEFLKLQNYITKLAVVSAPKEVSLESLKIRYEEAKKMNLPARFTKQEFHNGAYMAVENTLRELLKLSIFDEFFMFLRKENGFEEFRFSMERKNELLKLFTEGRKFNQPLSYELRKTN